MKALTPPRRWKWVCPKCSHVVNAVLTHVADLSPRFVEAEARAFEVAFDAEVARHFEQHRRA